MVSGLKRQVTELENIFTYRSFDKGLIPVIWKGLKSHLSKPNKSINNRQMN